MILASIMRVTLSFATRNGRIWPLPRSIASTSTIPLLVVAVGHRQARRAGRARRDAVELEVAEHRALERVVVLALHEPQVDGRLAVVGGDDVVAGALGRDPGVALDDLRVEELAVAHVTMPSAWLVTSWVRMSTGELFAGELRGLERRRERGAEGDGLVGVDVGGGGAAEHALSMSRTIGMRVEPPASRTTSMSSPLPWRP
jgi:hypothetical protein